MKVLISSRQRKIRLNLRRIESDARKALTSLRLQRAELSILFAGPRFMRGLNLRWRGVDRGTDVLSFPLFSSAREFPPEGDFPLGDIVIDPSFARRQAEERDIPLGEELRRLMVHGILHLLGYDHERDAAGARRMMRREREILRRMEVV